MRGKCRFWLHFILVLSLIPSTLPSLNPVVANPGASLLVFPSSIIDTTKTPGQTFNIQIRVAAVSNLFAFEFKLGYKTAILNATSISLGSFFPAPPGSFVIKKELNDTIGYVWYAVTLLSGFKSGAGTLATISFTVESLGATCIYLFDTMLSDPNSQPLEHEAYDGHFVNSDVHDIGLTSVKPFSDRVIQNETVDVTVVARNHGNFTENFTVTAYANSTFIGTPIMVTDLPPGGLNSQPTTLTFTWNTTGVPLGKYFILANATTVTNEVDTTDNTYNMTFDFGHVPHAYVPITIAVRKPPIAVFDYSPKLPHIKEPVTFNASESLPEGGVIDTYEWDFADTNRTSPSIYYKVHNNTFVVPGTFNVTLTVMDSEDLTDTAWKLITVYPPDVAVINVTAHPTDVTKPNPITINVTVENKGGLGTFDVTACYDGKPIGDPQTITSLKEGTNKTLTFMWDTTYVPATTAGTIYEISGNATELLYEENMINNRLVFGDVTIYKPSGPSANFTYSPKNPYENVLVNFDASLSTRDPRTNAPIQSYAWDYDDGVKEIYIEGVNITQIATHTYTTAGNYVVKLNVTDSNGLWDAAEASLTVYVGPPVASFTYSPTSPIIGNITTFNAWTSTPNGGTIKNYTWNFGDNNITTVTIYIINHLYATAGTYTVTLNVTDTEGFWNTTSKIITIYKKTSTITIAASPSAIKLGEATAISGAITPTKGSAEVTLSYRKTGVQIWNIIAAVPTNLTSEYSYTWTPTIQGTFEIKANWTGDADTLQAESEVGQLIVKAFPIASFTYAPSASAVGETVTFTSTSTDPDGSINSWDWNFGDGAHGNSETATHVYATAGDFAVTLVVTDNDGLTNTQSITVTIKEAAGFPFYVVAGAVIIVIVAISVLAYILMRKKR